MHASAGPRPSDQQFSLSVMAPKKELRMLDSSASYTVGWIAALAHERAAALMMLDERHSKPKDFAKHPSDANSYTWGQVAEHNVVVASLPAGEYGTVSAAGTANGLRASLPHIRVGLLVGIGAGVPGNNILLGDVVVSNPDGAHGGVVQYDLYKAKNESGSSIRERKGFLDSPPRVLRAALGALQAEHEISGSAVPELLEVFQGNKLMQVPYGYPGAEKDRLRLENTNFRDSLAIHYGAIASGNTLIKDCTERDALIKWLEQNGVKPMCFEMEAAGLMNSFPCLVIRGICDYADEHKDDTWQKYAAATAAAFAKELLGYIDGEEMEETAKISEVLGDSK